MTALTAALNTLLIHIPSEAEVHPSTWAAKAAHHITSRWLSGQLWAWDGGDAITVLTGGLYGAPDHRVFFVIRLGDNVHVMESQSFKDAMESLGYTTKIDQAYYDRVDAEEAEREAGSAGL
jgi:hypothetical protein